MTAGQELPLDPGSDGLAGQDGLPDWANEFIARLAVSPQIVLTGNVADLHVARPAGQPAAGLHSTSQVVRACLQAVGYPVVVGWHAVRGIEIVHEQEPDAVRELLEPELWNRRQARPTATDLAELLRRVVAATPRTAVIIEGAPRLTPEPGRDEELHRTQVVAYYLAQEGRRRRLPGQASRSVYNTVVWVVERESELAHWLVGAPGVQVISVPQPTLAVRTAAAATVIDGLPGAAALDAAARRGVIDRLAAQTEGLQLSAMQAVQRLAVDRQIAATEVEDAVRFLRSGLRTSPWRDADVQKRVANAAAALGEQVIGQQRAVLAATDILIRASLGLTGAQSLGHPGRPQGVMFLAGPTGTGKTELAKQIARLVFGKEEAMVRFDMSEFSAEHTQARLLGAPPGYVGHEAGGELTNAVRQRPFSLLLFDEIDKADRRILDKFLQILEDGRLTDGAGSTVHFGETLIVFTSNLGVMTHDARGELVPLSYDTPYDELEATVQASIRREFLNTIKRPELLNRIGKNIIVFGYITADAARRILRRNLENVAVNVRARTGVRVSFGPALIEALDEVVSQESCLLNGGRGVGSVIESHVVNPLGRHLLGRPANDVLEIVGCYQDESGHHLRLVPGTR